MAKWTGFKKPELKGPRVRSGQMDWPQEDRAIMMVMILDGQRYWNQNTRSKMIAMALCRWPSGMVKKAKAEKNNGHGPGWQNVIVSEGQAKKMVMVMVDGKMDWSQLVRAKMMAMICN